MVSVLPVPHEYNPKWVFWKNGGGKLSLSTGDTEIIPRRQDLPPAFHRDGSVYITRSEIVVNQQSLYGGNVQGYEMSPEFSANIDTEEDWQAIEKRFVRQ